MRKLGQGVANAQGGGLMPEGHDFDRQRKFAQGRHGLGRVGDHHATLRGLPHQLLAQQGRAAALDEGQARPDLVGAVDGQVDASHLVKFRQDQAQARREGRRGLRGRHAAQLEPLDLGPPAQSLDQIGRGRAGAQADRHAVLDQGGGGLAGQLLLQLDVAHGLAFPLALRARKALAQPGLTV